MIEQARIVTVVGLGKIGLPLAVQIAKMGFFVYGVDSNPSVVEKINLGEVPFPGEHNLDNYLKEVISKGSFEATLDTSGAVFKSGVVIVVVPLYVDNLGVPDFKSIDSATIKIGEGLQVDTLVSYETTLPVGTTRNRFARQLEEVSGLKAGTSFHLVFSPERVLTGRVFEDLKKYPKLVGGVNSESESRGIRFYSQVLKFSERPDLSRSNGVWPMGGCEAAELAKLAETTYRDVNIGLANQFALFAESQHIDIHKVIEASNSQFFSHIHSPGIAVGGHCIPIYPQMYLLNDPDASIVSAARAMNAAMPMKCIDILEQLHYSLHNCKVAVLGVSYRGGVKESAFSGVFSIVDILKSRGAHPLVHDPLYSDSELQELGLDVYHIGTPVDAVVVQANHEVYRDFNQEMFPNVKTVLDGRGILNSQLWESTKFHKLGQGLT